MVLEWMRGLSAQFFADGVNFEADMPSSLLSTRTPLTSAEPTPSSLSIR